MYQVVTSDYVKVAVTTSHGSDVGHEKIFLKSITVGDLKAKLELLTGGNSASMKIQVFEKDSEKLVCSLDNDDAPLGSYPVDDGMRLHIVDNFALRKSFCDVPKYELSQEEYAQKKGTLRDFLARNKLGKYDEEKMKEIEERKKAEAEEEEKVVAAIKVGARCQVKVPAAPARLGTVMYIGEVQGLNGTWVGVKYDEPLGKNDGSIEGKRYFNCPPKYGGFTKPVNITVGDFPEEDFGLDEI